ncbi:hypothetical protein [Actinophytocola sediminis]
MIDNDELRQAFGSLERHAPAEENVLTGVYQGIHRRRRRRQIGSVAAVAGVASLTALSVVLVSGPGQGTETQDGTSLGVAAAPPPATAPAPPALPFTAGWLPKGYTLNAWDVDETAGSAQYTGAGDFQTVVVWISDQPREAPQGAVDEPATIAGQQGTVRELAPAGSQTQLIWQLADGRWAMVGGVVPTVPLDALHRVAKHVGAQPSPLDVELGLRGLPDGYQVAGWTGSTPTDGSVTLCQSDVELRGDERPADCITMSMKTGTAPATVIAPRTPKDQPPVKVPVDQEEVVDGVVTRTTADGVVAIAQVDPGHWVQAYSEQAGDDALRVTVARATAG